MAMLLGAGIPDSESSRASNGEAEVRRSGGRGGSSLARHDTFDSQLQ